MRRAFILILGCTLLAGCATSGGHKTQAAPKAAALEPSPFAVVGHVISADLGVGNIIIDVSPYAVLPLGYDGMIMFARTDDLHPTAKLQASHYLRGHILGARLLAGRPNIGDEVVIPPATR
ncbi:MAG TPA: hypothetical protein VL357_02055 [Rariglobus sp.]|jgi:hypothetical protein|nr:hypothetical protein [Rariglobus sp.]